MATARAQGAHAVTVIAGECLVAARGHIGVGVGWRVGVGYNEVLKNTKRMDGKKEERSFLFSCFFRLSVTAFFVTKKATARRKI